MIAAPAACVVPPPNPPAGAPLEQVLEAKRWQIAWTFALADGRRAVVHFRSAYCLGR